MPLLPITITGNLTKDPWLKKLSSGNCLGRMRVAASRRIRDESIKGGWRDVDNLYLSVECWGQLAFNAKKSLTRGMPVIVSGILVTHEWIDEDSGEKQQRIILRASQIGLDLARYVVGSKKSEPLEHNVDGIPMPDLEANEDTYDELAEGALPTAPTQPVRPAQPAQPRSSFDRGLEELGQPPHPAPVPPTGVDAAPSQAAPTPPDEALGADDGNVEAGAEPVGAGADQGGGPPF